jgi:hypothetical protein
MKKFKYIFILSALLAGFTACEEDSDELTGNENTGGLVKIDTPLIGYVVGNGLTKPYEASITIDQGSVATTKIDVYKSFTDTKGTTNPDDDVVSNEVLLKTFTLSGDKHQTIDFEFNYNELVQGLTLAGQPMPNTDGALNIGDSWTLRFVSSTTNGEHSNSKTLKVSIGTRFAGKYKCINAEYYRLGVLTYGAADWPAVTVIESINATTYKVNEYFGPEVFSSNEYYFTIDSNDKIDYPATKPSGAAQVGNGQPMITCLTNPTDMTNVYCGSSNFVTRDDVNGKDRLTMSFGYYTTSGTVGPRTFYQVLEKIVE